MRIAILEDEASHADYAEKLLANAGNVCAVFADGKDLVRALRRETFDMLVLDWNVPTMSGMDILEWIRHNFESRPPILMVTSRFAEEDIVAGLMAGADDYIIKPVPAAVLMARVTALARRAYPEPSLPLETFGPYQLDSRADVISVGGKPIVLTAKEHALAVLLFRNLNRALSRAYLLETIWGVRPDLSTRTLDVHISNIRTKLNLRPENGFKLIPIYSYGYRLESLS